MGDQRLDRIINMFSATPDWEGREKDLDRLDQENKEAFEANLDTWARMCAEQEKREKEEK